MKILMFSWRGPKHPNEGGAEASTWQHLTAWVKNGHQVTLFTSFFEGAQATEKINGIQVIRRGNQILSVQWEAFKWSVFKQHQKYDVVIDQFHGIPFFTPLYVREKITAFIHETAKEVWWLNPLPFPINLIYGAIGWLLEPLIFILFYHRTPFITVSESTKSDLVKWGISRNQIKVIPNGIDKVPFKNRFPKEKIRTAIYLGAIAKDKGIEEAILSFGEIKKTDRYSWQFWVVGRGDPRYISALKNKCKELGIYNQVIFWGFVDNKKKYELLSKAHVLVNPSFREGWGLVNIEANCVGTPVIGYQVAGMVDSVLNGKTGYLVKKHDYQALTRSVIKLVNDQKSYRNIQINCLKWSSRFNWEDSTRESLRLLLDTL